MIDWVSNRTLLVLLTLLSTVFATHSSADACTAIRFDFDGHLVVARNHDWMFGEGWLLIQPSGLQKRAITPLRPADWTSRFGSVTLTQFGRGIPFAGMNEKGLTIDLLQLGEAEFSTAPLFKQDAVDVIQWVQYQLDMCETVEEVVATLEDVLPIPFLPSIETVHYIATDCEGGVAIVEFLNGKPVIHWGPESENCVLANTVHADARNNRHTKTDSRYSKGVAAIEKFELLDQAASVDFDAVDRAFESLQAVAQPSSTQWSLVYEPQDRRLTFKTVANPVRRFIDLDDLDLATGSDVMILSLQHGTAVDAKKTLQLMTQENDIEIVNSGFDQYFPNGVGRMVVKKLITDNAASIRSVSTVAPPVAVD